MTAEREMPKYQCHKQVWALKIADLRSVTDGDGFEAGEGDIVLVPADEGYGPFIVGRDYCAKHRPEIGGYYVVYADGYKSYSPADAFESGYTRI